MSLPRISAIVPILLVAAAIFPASPLATPLSAQVRPAATAASNKPANVSVTFSYVSLGQDILDVKYDTAGKAAAIKYIPSGYKPLALPYSGPEILEFYREVKGADGKPARDVIATAKIPASSGNFLVLFKGTSPDRFGTLVLPDTLTPGSANSWRIINTTRRYIAFQMKDFKRQEVIPPMQSRMLELGTKEGYSEVATYLPDPKNPKAWVLAHSTRRFYMPGNPSLLIYRDDPGDLTHLSVTRLHSAIKPPEPAAGTAAPAPAQRRGATPAPRRR
ncbi:MAG: hypothetical protein LBG65_07070 [Puniceicoccales bacterium]|nr:hypothetical protein [Puniceicoccales bacterium]